MAANKDQIQMTIPYNLSSSQWELVHSSLQFRQQNSPACDLSIERLSLGLLQEGNKEKVTPLLQSLEELNAQFFAMVEEAKIQQAFYHTSYHANEMCQDIQYFVFEALTEVLGQSDLEAQFYASLAASMGAAHDIIQNKRPPENEHFSEAICLKYLKKCFEDFIQNEQQLSTDDKESLMNFTELSLPLICREVISNGTYLLMGDEHEGLAYPIRDFGFVLNEIAKESATANNLNPILNIIQLALSFCDVRRSELNFVLKKHALLKSIPASHYPELNTLLQAVGLLSASKNEKIETLQAQLHYPKESRQQQCTIERLKKIEGFLLRFGQNLRIQPENTLKFNLGTIEDQQSAQAFINYANLMRIQNGEDRDSVVSPDVSERGSLHFFLENLSGDPYSEAAFACGLGKSAREIVDSMTSNDALRSFILKEFVSVGWQQHQTHLTLLKDSANKWSVSELQKMNELFTLIAAKQPGIHFSQNCLRTLELRLASLEDLAFLETRTERTEEELTSLNDEASFSLICGKSLQERINSLRERITEQCLLHEIELSATTECALR